MALNDVQQLSPTGVTAGTYPNASITVDSQGRVISASGNPNSVSTISAGPGITGGGSGSVTIGIAPSGVISGTYTNTNLTVDATGRITAASPGPAPIPPAPPSGSQTFTSPGVFLVPSGVTSVLVTMIGGGGGGGACGNAVAGSGGGGGSGGQIYAQSVAVTGGTNIPVTVGSGGPGGPLGVPSPSGTPGGSSSFLSLTCTGGGGGGGGYGGGGAGGPGGSPNGNFGSPGGQFGTPGGAGGEGGIDQLAGFGGGGGGGGIGTTATAGKPGTSGKVFLSWG